MSVLNPATEANTTAPPLRAKIAPWMQSMLAKPSVLRDLIEQHGSPVHVVVDSEFKRNVGDLLSPFKARGLGGGLYFARKANKLPWFVQAAKDAGIGVDTASLSELKESLELGVPAEKLTLTAIGKDKQLIEFAIEAGAMIVIDNFDELQQVEAIALKRAKQARIGLRFSGFVCNGRQIFSRFGFPVQDAPQLLDRLSSNANVSLELLHAHLDRYDIDERAAAARHLIRLADRAKQIGIDVNGIDLGGGILIRYLESQIEFENFRQSLVDAVRGQRPSFTYLQDGLGHYRVADEVHGKADLYPAWNDCSKERFISSVLDHTEGSKPLHQELQERNLQLFFEPGRALLDNGGITLSTVMFRKRDTLGNLLIGLAMNRTHLRPFRAEFCSDPIVMTFGRREALTEGAFVVGNLCSESDLIYRRMLELTAMPEPDDIFFFVNTAGYLAHHLEVGTHGNPLPTNVLLDDSTLEVRDVHPNRG